MFLSWKIYILENISHFLGSGKLHNICNFRYVKEMPHVLYYKTCEISDTLWKSQINVTFLGSGNIHDIRNF